MKNGIEEDIILLKDFTEGNFKRDKLENYKGSYKMGYFYYKDIQQALEHILSDYKRVLKENEELKSKNKTLEELLQGNLYELYKYYKELAGAYQGNCILVQEVKDKMEKDIKTNEHTILGGRRNGKTLEYGKRLGRIEMCQELLEGRK